MALTWRFVCNFRRQWIPKYIINRLYVCSWFETVVDRRFYIPIYLHLYYADRPILGWTVLSTAYVHLCMHNCPIQHVLIDVNCCIRNLDLIVLAKIESIKAHTTMYGLTSNPNQSNSEFVYFGNWPQNISVLDYMRTSYAGATRFGVLGLLFAWFVCLPSYFHHRPTS